MPCGLVNSSKKPFNTEPGFGASLNGISLTQATQQMMQANGHLIHQIIAQLIHILKMPVKRGGHKTSFTRHFAQADRTKRTSRGA